MSRIATIEFVELIIEIADSNSEIVYDDPRDDNIRHSEADITKTRKHLEYGSTVAIANGLEMLAEETTYGETAAIRG